MVTAGRICLFTGRRTELVLAGIDCGFNAVHFGDAADIPAPGDFDGDRKTDISVFRPSNGFWYRINSSDGAFSFVEWGLNGDIPQAGDYDGDGHADQAVFRPSSGTWYWIRSSTQPNAGMQFGQNGDRPVAADYDGDGISGPVRLSRGSGIGSTVRTAHLQVSSSGSTPTSLSQPTMTVTIATT